jgi:hypothetical protein
MEELLCDVVAIGEDDTDHWLSRAFERGECCFLVAILFACQSHADEHAVIPIDIGRPQRLGIDRDKPLTLLSGRFGQ